jgi:hypothetical protein
VAAVARPDASGRETISKVCRPGRGEPVGARRKQAGATIAREDSELGRRLEAHGGGPTRPIDHLEASGRPERRGVVQDGAPDVGDPVEAVARPRQALAEVLEVGPSMDAPARPRPGPDTDLLGPDRSVPELDDLLGRAVLGAIAEIDGRRPHEAAPSGADRGNHPAQEVGLEEDVVVDDKNVWR